MVVIWGYPTGIGRGEPSCHIGPFRVWRISGLRDCVAFFVELGAAMIVASTIVPAFNNVAGGELFHLGQHESAPFPLDERLTEGPPELAELGADGRLAHAEAPAPCWRPPRPPRAR